jgi:hypothetical protein
LSFLQRQPQLYRQLRVTLIAKAIGTAATTPTNPYKSVTRSPSLIRFLAAIERPDRAEHDHEHDQCAVIPLLDPMATNLSAVMSIWSAWLD